MSLFACWSESSRLSLYYAQRQRPRDKRGVQIPIRSAHATSHNCIKYMRLARECPIPFGRVTYLVQNLQELKTPTPPPAPSLGSRQSCGCAV